MLLLVPVSGWTADESPSKASPLSREIEHLLSMSVNGTLVVDTDGSVRDYALTTTVTPGLAEALGKTIKAWRFEPVLVDGQPTRAEAKMRISLAATENGKDYQVHVENAVFRPATPSAQAPARTVEATGRSMNPPVYPRELQRAFISGRVLVALHFTPEGKVIEAVPVQSMIFDARGGSDRTYAKAIKQFEDATLAAVRKWTVSVQVKPGAPTSAKDFTTYTTVDYRMGDGPNGDIPGEWRRVSRTPRAALPWLPATEAPKVGVADVAAGESFPLADALHLASPVSDASL